MVAVHPVLLASLLALVLSADAVPRAPPMSKSNLPAKLCVVCARPFTWRKKWERCWEEVSTCSQRCNTERRLLARKERRADVDILEEGLDKLSTDERTPTVQDNPRRSARSRPAMLLSLATDTSQPDDRIETCVTPGDESGSDSARAERKAAKAAAKQKRREVREGRAHPTFGQKPCDLCATSVDLLIRCQMDNQQRWRMVCGRCWKLPAVAGGVVDGDGSNPHYRYGGLWKNLHKP